MNLASALLSLRAAAHSQDERAAQRFEGRVALTTSQLLKSGGKALNRRASRRTIKTERSVRERLVSVQLGNWDADLYELIMAYALVRQQQGHRGS